MVDADDDTIRPFFFIEKDALHPIVSDIAERWDVPVISTRGYASLSQLYAVSRRLTEEADHVGGFAMLWLHDWDEAGGYMEGAADRTLRQLTELDIQINHVALTETQVAEWDIPTRPGKRGQAAAAELDAIDPAVFRRLVLEAIEAYLPKDIGRHVDAENKRIAEDVRQRVERILYNELGDVRRGVLYGVDTTYG